MPTTITASATIPDRNLALLDTVDARSRLAGSNTMEILLFSLGTGEIFGINVFKVREVCQTPPVTRTPNVPYGVEGVISLRGSIIPVIALAKFTRLEEAPEDTGHTMIVTEFSRHVQGFLVHDVDRIIRVDWEKIRPPQAMLAGEDANITAVTELPDGRLVSILDVEKILAGVIGIEAVPDLPSLPASHEATVFFADDSAVARKEIVMVLDKLGAKYQQATNGQEAWDKLRGLATRVQADGKPLSSQVKLILVDVEMPEMDGYVLVKNIREDKRFDGIPVVMHTSLSTEANRNMGKTAGADAYVAKFDPEVLAETLRPFLLK